jgi:serine/threonine-protein kinase
MEHLDGQSLEQVLDREAPLVLHRALGIVHQIASALAAAHAKGIIHSDLKPANVMLARRAGRRELIRAAGPDRDGHPRFVVEKEGWFDSVKVLDFGIARVHDPGAPTPAGEPLFGTPEYMAPEAARGEPLTPAADVYALGLLFYEMVTGEVPFPGDTAIAVLRRQLFEAPLPPRRARADVEITDAAERLILSMLAKPAAARPASMDEVRAALPACYGSVAFRRDAERVPGAMAQGLAPRRRRLTDELDEWLAREKARLAAGAEAKADALDPTDAVDLTDALDPEAPDPTEPAPPGEPLLLTHRKPRG